MKLEKQWKSGITLVILFVIAFAQYGCSLQGQEEKMPVRVFDPSEI